MATITLPQIPATSYEAMRCHVCGADAAPAKIPLCPEHHSAWCDSDSWRLACDTECALRLAFAEALRLQHQAKQLPVVSCDGCAL